MHDSFFENINVFSFKKPSPYSWIQNSNNGSDLNLVSAKYGACFVDLKGCLSGYSIF